jgi:hypothetical protein
VLLSHLDGLDHAAADQLRQQRLCHRLRQGQAAARQAREDGNAARSAARARLVRLHVQRRKQAHDVAAAR